MHIIFSPSPCVLMFPEKLLSTLNPPKPSVYNQNNSREMLSLSSKGKEKERIVSRRHMSRREGKLTIRSAKEEENFWPRGIIQEKKTKKRPFAFGRLGLSFVCFSS